MVTCARGDNSEGQTMMKAYEAIALSNQTDDDRMYDVLRTRVCEKIKECASRGERSMVYWGNSHRQSHLTKLSDELWQNGFFIENTTTLDDRHLIISWE